jgi:uncharacterized membrane protein YkoI
MSLSLSSIRYTLVAASLVALPTASFASDYETRAEAQAVLDMPVTLSKAVEVAQTAMPGKVIDAEIEQYFHKLVCEVKIVGEGHISKALIDMTTGKMVSSQPTESKINVKQLYKSNYRLSALEHAGMTMTDAIAAAEKISGGKAYEASFNYRDGAYAYEVKTVKDRSKMSLTLHADSGEILASKFKVWPEFLSELSTKGGYKHAVPTDKK